MAAQDRRRWYLIGGFLFFLAALPVGYWFLAGWLHERELAAIYRELDAEDPDWRWFDLIARMPAPPPDDRNGAVQILKARQLLNNPALLRAVKENTTTFQAQEVRNALGKLSPAILDEARKLKDMPEGRFAVEATENPFEKGHDPGLGLGVLSVEKLLWADAMLRAHDGNTEEAAESCLALLNTVHVFEDHPHLMLQLVRMQGQNLAALAIERALGQGVVSDKRLEELQAALTRETDGAGLYHALRAERAAWHQLFVLAKQGKASISKVLDDSNISSWVPAHVREIELMNGYPEQLRIENELVRASKLRDEEGMAAFRELAKKVISNAGTVAPSQILIYAEVQQRSQTLLRCAITAVAAERYRLKHRNWPISAEDLVKAGLMKDSWKDPFDGQPLRWRRTATGVIIYAVGPDKVDDGGKLNRGDRRVAGTDIGFELWDEPTSRGRALPEEINK